MENYPTIALILKWGEPLSAVLAALLPLGALLLVLQGASWLVLVAGIVAGAVAYGLLRSYVEVLRVIADTLIPR
jgi:hypothetical protein